MSAKTTYLNKLPLNIHHPRIYRPFYSFLDLAALRLHLTFRQPNDHKRPFAGVMPITLAALTDRDAWRIAKACVQAAHPLAFFFE